MAALSPSRFCTRSFISRAAFSVKVMARISSGSACLFSIRKAMRSVKTEVLPVPAPASTSIGPVVCSIACFCLGLGMKDLDTIGQGKNHLSGIMRKISEPGNQKLYVVFHRESITTDGCSRGAPQPKGFYRRGRRGRRGKKSADVYWSWRCVAPYEPSWLCVAPYGLQPSSELNTQIPLCVLCVLCV